MTIEQIAIRQEIRQMLNEAGINKNTLKDMVNEVLTEELEKACKQALHENNTNSIISRKINEGLNNQITTAIKDCIRERVNGIFHRMTISVDITDNEGKSSLIR